MVRTSLKSEVLPVIEAGGRTVYIPADITWTHEGAPPTESGKHTFRTHKHLDQLPVLVETMLKEVG